MNVPLSYPQKYLVGSVVSHYDEDYIGIVIGCRIVKGWEHEDDGVQLERYGDEEELLKFKPIAVIVYDIKWEDGVYGTNLLENDLDPAHRELRLPLCRE